MDFHELVLRRESCRSFNGQPAEREKLVQMLKDAHSAPSACNSQPWHFVLADGENARIVAKAAQAGLGMNKFTDKCPAFIIICQGKGSFTARAGGKLAQIDYAPYDIGLATAHLIFSATAQGLSTCILGWFSKKQVKEAFHIPAGVQPVLALAVGYAEKTDVRPKSRRPFAEIWHDNKW